MLSLIAITLIVIAVRYPASAYATSQLSVYVAAQLLWLAIDLLRSRLAFWRAPVTPI